MQQAIVLLRDLLVPCPAYWSRSAALFQTIDEGHHGSISLNQSLETERGHTTTTHLTRLRTEMEGASRSCRPELH